MVKCTMYSLETHDYTGRVTYPLLDILEFLSFIRSYSCTSMCENLFTDMMWPNVDIICMFKVHMSKDNE